MSYNTDPSTVLGESAARVSADELRAEIGARVRTQRKKRDMSLRDLARSLGVSAATISAVENGHTGLTSVRLAQIAGVLGTEAAILMPADERSFPQQTQPVLPSPAIPVGTAESWRQYGPLQIDPILTSALRLFVDVGFHGATMRQIASRAGMSVAGVYHYYPSKQDVLAALLDLTMADLLARSTSAREEGTTAVERFSLIIECLALFHSHRRDLGFVGASETRSLTGQHRVNLTAARLVQQRMVDDEIARAAESGEFVVESPRAAGRAVTMLCTGLCQWFREGGAATAEEVAHEYVRYALNLVGYNA